MVRSSPRLHLGWRPLVRDHHPWFSTHGPKSCEGEGASLAPLEYRVPMTQRSNLRDENCAAVTTNVERRCDRPLPTSQPA
jgi:hypothetical protein